MLTLNDYRKGRHTLSLVLDKNDEYVVLHSMKPKVGFGLAQPNVLYRGNSYYQAWNTLDNAISNVDRGVYE